MNEKDVLAVPWRVGRKLGRTVYAQTGVYPSDNDTLLGMVETREIAEHICEWHNWILLASRTEGP